MDELFDAIEERLRGLARSSNPMAHDCATFSQVDLVVELRAVAQVIADNCAQILMGGYAQWAELADMLAVAAKACQNEVVIEQAESGRQ